MVIHVSKFAPLASSPCHVAAMLRVWSISGEELAAVSASDGFVKDVVGLKCHLRSQHGFAVCRQQLLLAGRCLGNLDPLVGPVDLQLVLLSALSTEQMPQAENEFLEYAADTGHVEVGRALLALGVNKNSQNKSGVTALMRAARGGHVGIVRLLLDARAEMNLQDRSGQTALMHACSQGHVETVRLLLVAGFDKHVQHRSLATALLRASSAGHVEIVHLLMGAGGPPGPTPA